MGYPEQVALRPQTNVAWQYAGIKKVFITLSLAAALALGSIGDAKAGGTATGAYVSAMTAAVSSATG